jgi:phospholipid-binding lipoprotein MlaA
MRYVAAATALALGISLSGGAHAQTPAAPASAVAPAPPAAAAAPTVAPTPADQGGDKALASGVRGVERTPGDPFEHFNRDMFGFNNALDKAAIEPLARGYRAATPGFFRSGVRNVLHNLASPVIFANDVLQGEPLRAGDTAGRFFVNTTVGVFGLFDFATHAGIPSHDEDFGQTLGKWGVGGGPYLMLPLLGPSNVRDLTGKVVDIAIDPLTYAKFRNDDAARVVRFGADELTQRTDSLDGVESLRESSVDPYAAVRSIYNQSRNSAILNGHDGAPDSPDSDESLSR